MEPYCSLSVQFCGFYTWTASYLRQIIMKLGEMLSLETVKHTAFNKSKHVINFWHHQCVTPSKVTQGTCVCAGLRALVMAALACISWFPWPFFTHESTLDQETDGAYSCRHWNNKYTHPDTNSFDFFSQNSNTTKDASFMAQDMTWKTVQKKTVQEELW